MDFLTRLFGGNNNRQKITKNNNGKNTSGPKNGNGKQLPRNALNEIAPNVFRPTT